MPEFGSETRFEIELPELNAKFGLTKLHRSHRTGREAQSKVLTMDNGSN